MGCIEKYMNNGKIEERPCEPIDISTSHIDHGTTTMVETKIGGCLAGTELKRLLATIGIKTNSSCSCNTRATEMDSRGCDWCADNIDTIVGWLREEAEKRKLPFIDMAGRILVKRAIRNARKNQKII